MKMFSDNFFQVDHQTATEEQSTDVDNSWYQGKYIFTAQGGNMKQYWITGFTTIVNRRPEKLSQWKKKRKKTCSF